MEGKVIDGIKKELRKEPEDWSCKFSFYGFCRFGEETVSCTGKLADRKHCPVWMGRT